MHVAELQGLEEPWAPAHVQQPLGWAGTGRSFPFHFVGACKEIDISAPWTLNGLCLELERGGKRACRVGFHRPSRLCHECVGAAVSLLPNTPTPFVGPRYAVAAALSGSPPSP